MKMETIGAVLVIAGVLIMIYALYIWAGKPELSQMQYLILTWKENLIGVILLLLGTSLINK